MPETTQFGGNKNNSNDDGTLKPDTILLTRYKIEGQLGGGGQGAVYQARDLNFPEARRLVAIKEMHITASEPTLRAEALRTFQREANILATLNHPAIPSIYDFFEKDARAYLVMEYINGRDLEAILHKTKSLPMKKIIEWAITLCDVLHYLHSQEPEPIIFRDMKPANVMIDSLGKVRLIDYGIAKVFVKDLPQTMIGTEGYSAPEQYKGKANPTSDIYSLGATLHHVITRKDPRLEPPFSFSERPLKQYNEEATEALQAIIGRALEFEAGKRYQSLAEMKEDLESLQYGVQRDIAVMSAPSANGGAAKTDQPSGSTNFFDTEEGTEGSIVPLWTFKTEDEIRSSPTIFRNIALVGSYDSNVWAVNVETGDMLWKRHTDAGIATSPIVDPEMQQVLFGSEDYTHYAIDVRDGRMNWSHTTGDKIRSSGTLAHGHIFFGSDDGKLYALLANNGRVMWEYEVGVPIRSQPCATADRIIFGTDDGEVIALELNGQRKWSFRTRRSIMASPVVDRDDMAYVASMDGYLYAIDAANGYSQWKFRTLGPIISSPALDTDDNIYVCSADGHLYCVNTQSGRERWKFESGAPIVAGPRLHDGVVYFGGTNGKFYAVDAKKGKEIWSFETGSEITSLPYIGTNVILFGALNHTLYALPLIGN